MRYIDDIFIIWTGTPALLATFVDTLNQNQFNLKFTVASDLQQITFLDLTNFKDRDNCLASTLFRKQTAGNTLLHADSAHPMALIQSIPYAQYLKLRGNCTQLEEFKTQANHLQIQLRSRGYSKSLQSSAYNKALRQSLISLLFKTKTVASNNTVNYITRYSQQHGELCNILKTHWSLLQEDPIISKYISPHLEITFRRARSLKDKLVSSH